VYFTFLLRIL